MKVLTVKKMWDDFAARSVLCDLGSVQYKEMRKAFYAGVGSFMVESTGLSDDEDIAVANMNMIGNEIKKFWQNEEKEWNEMQGKRDG